MPPKGSGQSFRASLFEFLNGTTTWGWRFTMFSVFLIIANIACFIISTVDGWDHPFFNNLEDISVVIFTVEYLLRLYACAEDPEHQVYCKTDNPKIKKQTIKNDKAETITIARDDSATRIKWVFSFYSLVDLCCILPFYVELYSFYLTKAACGGHGIEYDLPASQFLRMFRLFRIMRVEGRYLEAFSVFDDIYRDNKQLLFTSGFVGSAVWVILSGANWLCERNNPKMEGRFDTIAKASYFTLCNLFGEFPVVNERTPMGKLVAVITAGVAVAVFAIPTGIFGNGFAEHASKKAKETAADVDEEHIEPSDSLTGKIYKFVYAKNSLGVIYERLMMALIVGNVSGFIVGSTAWAEKDAQISGFLDGMESVSVVVFSIDYVLRFIAVGEIPRYQGLSGRVSYLFTFYSIVDLAAVLPFYVTWLTPLEGINTSFIRALRLLRMLKMESYMKAFTVFDDILYNNKDVLTVTGFAAVVLWIFFSSVMYMLEKDNPQMISPRGENYYRSIPAAMWPTLLNLCGEVPLADYTPLGKVVSGIMGVVAVGSFAIPIGILGDGFQEWIEEKYQGAEEEEEGEKVQVNRSLTTTWTGKIHRFLEGETYLGSWFQTGLFYLVFLSVAQQALETVPSVNSEYGWLLDGVEFACVVAFLIEYFLRFLSAEHDPEFQKNHNGYARLSFLVSFYSIIDILTIAPYFWTLAYPGGQVDQFDEAFRMLRVLRLLKMDKYIPSITLIDDVFRDNAVPLGVTGFAAAVFWVIFSTMMWMAEDGDAVVTGDNGISQAERFKDVPSAMPYTLILLSGDYPLCDFTFWGMVTCFLMCLFAVSIVSIPSSIIASGFTSVATRERKKRNAREGRKTEESKEVKVEPPAYLNDKSTAAEIHSFLSPDDDNGVWFDHLMRVFIMTNVAMVVLESDPTMRAMIGENVFSYYEGGTAVVYTVLYLMRLVAAPYDPRASYSVMGFINSFFGTVDLLAFAPFYLEIAAIQYGVPYDFALPRFFRLFRVLQLEHYTEAFTLIDDVFRACKETLIATGFLAVIIWVGAAYLFFVFERENPAVEGAFENIPNSMYYTAIFLSGEWGQVDFTPKGKILCCVLVVAGIGLYSIPVGALFDAFGEVLEEKGQEEEEEENEKKNQ